MGLTQGAKLFPSPIFTELSPSLYHPLTSIRGAAATLGSSSGAETPSRPAQKKQKPAEHSRLSGSFRPLGTPRMRWLWRAIATASLISSVAVVDKRRRT